MRLRVLMFSIVCLSVASCAESPPITDARKAELRQLLSPKFTVATVPSEKREELYRILDAFAAKHREELITSITFVSPHQAQIAFSWIGGFHGGGAIAKKRWGKWTIEDIAYHL